MKADPHLKLVKGQRATAPVAGNGAGRPEPVAQEVLSLVSKENRRARQLGPASLEEAKKLLHGLVKELGSQPENLLAETHRLPRHCLVKLF